MGEWSKYVGETGEDLMSFLFKDIMGYKTVDNKPIECIKAKEHQRNNAKGPRNTHGVDGLTGYKSPVEDKVLEAIVSSSKFTSKKYPGNPKTQFKEHIRDLAQTLECFKYSKLFTDLKRQFREVDRTDVTGVLVWTSNESPVDHDVISQVANAQLDQDLIYDRIILIDNNRFNFLYDTLFMSKRVYGEDKVSVIYHNTGLNNATLSAIGYGPILPIHYAISNIIPLRIDNGGAVELLIFSKDSFNGEHLSQILTFAKTFDHLDSVSKVTIAFEDYDNLQGSEIVAAQLFKFDKYELNKNLFVKKFPSNFINN